MRSSCDLVIWVKTREAADHHVRFMRSANDVLLAEDTIGPQLFHSVRSCKAVRCCPPQRGHHIHNMLHFVHPLYCWPGTGRP